jgi:hypothetical protein
VLQRETLVRLTVAGLKHVERATQINRGFLWLLNLFCQRQATFTPNPHEVVDVTMSQSEILKAANASLEVSPVIGRVIQLLTDEPPLWATGYLQDNEQRYRLDTRLHDYLSISDIDDYLNRVWTVLAPRRPHVQRHVASPLNLVTSADYLGAIWELRTGKRLWGPTRHANAAALSFGCSTLEEFNSRLSSLGDLLGQIEIPNQPGERLDRLEKRLHELLRPSSHARVDWAVGTLRAARRLRAGAQHDDAVASAIDAFAVFGLRYPPSDWQAVWDQVRGQLIEAFDGIREELQAEAL